MKKTELRRMLKPLVKECVRETLLEEGLLSNIVSEVVRGFSPLLTENKTYQPIPDNETTQQQQQILEQQRQELQEEKRRRLKEQKIKMLNATGFGNKIFEGVEPLSQGGSDSDSPNGSALADIDPNDAGIDISGIMAVANRDWKDLV